MDDRGETPASVHRARSARAPSAAAHRHGGVTTHGGCGCSSCYDCSCGANVQAIGQPAPSMKPAKRSGSGRHLDDAAILQAEGIHVNSRRFLTERRERSADLAPMVGSVVQRPRQTDAHWSVPLEPVVRVDLTKYGVSIDALVEESRPSGAEVLHRSPELRKPH